MNKLLRLLSYPFGGLAWLLIVLAAIFAWVADWLWDGIGGTTYQPDVWPSLPPPPSPSPPRLGPSPPRTYRPSEDDL